MSRSDGSFPSYVKLDIDANNPPPGWNDGTRRCSSCGKGWPNMSIFSPSPCCNANTGPVATELPSVSWAESVAALKLSRFDRYYERWNEGMSDEQLASIDPVEVPFSEQELEKGLDDLKSFLDEVQSDATNTRT